MHLLFISNGQRSLFPPPSPPRGFLASTIPTAVFESNQFNGQQPVKFFAGQMEIAARMYEIPTIFYLKNNTTFTGLYMCFLEESL